MKFRPVASTYLNVTTNHSAGMTTLNTSMCVIGWIEVTSSLIPGNSLNVFIDILKLLKNIISSRRRSEYIVTNAWCILFAYYSTVIKSVFIESHDCTRPLFATGTHESVIANTIGEFLMRLAKHAALKWPLIKQI